MSKTRLSMYLVVLLVLVVGVVVLTNTLSHSADFTLIVRSIMPTGHVCTSTCTI